MQMYKIIAKHENCYLFSIKITYQNTTNLSFSFLVIVTCDIIPYHQSENGGVFR